MAVRKVLVIADPPVSYEPRADTTYLMIAEALRRNYAVEWAGPEHLYLENEKAWVHSAPLPEIRFEDHERFPPITVDTSKGQPLDEFSVVLMRKDPPVDADYITATWCLDRARHSTLIINDPQGLRDLNEKLAILEFPDLIPRTRLLRSNKDLYRTLEEFGGEMIVKPLLGFGGREIFHVQSNSRNLAPIFEVATQNNERWTIAQEFLPNASEGDKRILMVDGVAIGAVLRVASTADFRNNFHTGGHAVFTELDDADKKICEQVGPFLQARGQFFAGLDVIGGRLTEINLTSPTGMQEINQLGQLTGEQTMQAKFWEAIEARWESP